MLHIATVVAYGVMVAVNYLAVALPLAGRDTGAISDAYPNIFAPAGYAFSIWGLIYTLLGAYVVYQMWHKKNVLVLRVNRIFIINALLNASWLFAWHYDYIGLSVLILLGMAYTLARIVEVLRTQTLTKMEYWLMRFPFSVYFGWVTVASVANMVVFLVSVGWWGSGVSESLWTIGALIVGLGVGSWRLLRDRFFPYGLVLVWAYTAILYKHLSASGFAGAYPSVIFATVLCVSVFVLLTIRVSVVKK
jgi:MFS family permease